MDNKQEEVNFEQEHEYWSYEGPPGLYDLIQNNWLSNLLRLLFHVLIRIYLKYYHRIEYYNTKHLRDLPPCLIVANHASHLDTPAIFSAYPLFKINKIRSLAAKDYFFNNAFKRSLVFFIANIIPLNRSRFEAELFTYCRRIIKEGASLIIFPEGTRSTDGRMKDFKAGAGMLALQLQIPVLPVYIDGTFNSFPKGSILPKPKKIKVIFGEQVHYGNLPDEKQSWQEIAENLRQKVAVLSQSIKV